MAVISGDVRRVCHRLLQRLASARRAIIGISFPTIPWPMIVSGGPISSAGIDAELCNEEGVVGEGGDSDLPM